MTQRTVYQVVVAALRSVLHLLFMILAFISFAFSGIILFLTTLFPLSHLMQKLAKKYNTV